MRRAARACAAGDGFEPIEFRAPVSLIRARAGKGPQALDERRSGLPVESVVRFGCQMFLFALGACLSLSSGVAYAQQAGGRALAEDLSLTPEAERQLSQMLALSREQQKERARALINEYPNTRLAEILQRLLNEYAAFDAITSSEQQAREIRTSIYREYWMSRCCPEPAWNPPVARLVNSTTEPVLYEIRFNCLYRTLWMGPYRLKPGAEYTARYPYFVRYITSAGLQERVIAPGETYTFQGAPGSESFLLMPGMPPQVNAAPPAPTPAELPMPALPAVPGENSAAP
jgi:hypothetical protein